MQIEKLTLQGSRVRLEPLSASAHAAGLARAIADGALWQIPVTFVPHPEQLAPFFDDAERAFQQGRELAFATLDQASGAVLGSTRFRCIEPVHKRVEIGFTFIAQSYQRSHVNSEAKLLMLEHAFERWSVNRVELLTDLRNQKSRSAITRLGAREEGVLRSHMVMRDGYVRDSVLFSIVRAEWPAVRAALTGRLKAHDLATA